MSYQSLTDMKNSPPLQARIIACAAQEGMVDPDVTVYEHMWHIVARSDWIARWDDAVINYNPMYNPNFGERPDVITDGMILAAVQAVIAEINAAQ